MRTHPFYAALLILAGTANLALGQTVQPAAVPSTSDANQFLKAGVTRVIVRYEWRWDSGATGGGYWLAEQGVVTAVGPNWIMLSQDGSNKIHFIPFSAFKHLELLN